MSMSFSSCGSVYHAGFVEEISAAVKSEICLVSRHTQFFCTCAGRCSVFSILGYSALIIRPKKTCPSLKLNTKKSV